MISLNVARLLDQVGGPQGLMELLGRHGQPTPKYAAVAQWKSRNTLPRRWTAPVLYVLAQEGVPHLDLMDNLPDPDDPFAEIDQEVSSWR